MKPRTDSLERQGWKKRLEKSSTFTAVVVLNVALFLFFSTAVIWQYVSPHLDPPTTIVRVQKSLPKPPQPPAHGGESAKSNLDPTVVVVPPTTSMPSVVVTVNPLASFSIQTSRMPSITNSLPTFTQSASGSGLGQGTSGGGMAHANPFGDSAQDGVPGLVGELYDLKQTPDRRPNSMAVVPPESTGLTSNWSAVPAMTEAISVLRQYVKTWDQTILDTYYKAPIQLTATQILIPSRLSEEATKAFHVADKVIAKRWVIHYHGTIVPPKSGRFRFLGFGDDFLVVRIGSQNVLDGSYSGEQLDLSANGKDDAVPGPSPYPFNLRCGKWIDFEAGEPQSMDVLVGEGPGGHSGFYLLIQEQGDTSPKGDYPVFQIAPTAVPEKTGFPPVFTGKTMVFGAQ